MPDNNVGYTIRIAKSKHMGDVKAPTPDTITKEDSLMGNLQKQAVTTALINIGAQAIAQGIQQYGEMTGNTRLARDFNTMISVSSDILTIAKTGWVGAIAVVGKYGISAVTRTLEVNRANKQIEFSNETIGYISREGSRYY